MNYVEKLRQAIMAELPELSNELADFYTLLGLLFGEYVDNENVHDAWAVWRNSTDPYHKSIIPFNELTKEVQDLDTKYTEGIITAVKKVRLASQS